MIPCASTQEHSCPEFLHQNYKTAARVTETTELDSQESLYREDLMAVITPITPHH